jgi:hypothetical protein
VVYHCELVDVWDGVLEVDKLSAERVHVAGDGTYVGLAEGSADDLQGAAVVWEGDGGPVFGGGCGSGRQGWCLVWWLYNNTSYNQTKDITESFLQPKFNSSSFNILVR